jgi:hypothetical protein
VKALWWTFILTLAAFVVHVRYARDPDEFCEYCLRDIDTERDGFVAREHAVELGVVRAYDTWYFCSFECEATFLDELGSGHDNDAGEG